MRWKAWAAVVAVGVMVAALATSSRPTTFRHGYDLQLPGVAYIQSTTLMGTDPPVIPCRLNGRWAPCEVDTGNTFGLVMSSSMATNFGIALGRPESTTSVNAWVEGYSISTQVTVGDRSVYVQGIAFGGPVHDPLLGIPALRALAPHYLIIDFTAGHNGSVYFLSH